MVQSALQAALCRVREGGLSGRLLPAIPVNRRGAPFQSRAMPRLAAHLRRSHTRTLV